MKAIDKARPWAGVRFGTIQSLELKRDGRRPKDQGLQWLISGQDRRAGSRRSKGALMKWMSGPRGLSLVRTENRLSTCGVGPQWVS